jgi:hypothetical protein
MIKEINILKFTREITDSEQKKIISFAKALTSNKESVKTVNSEYPKTGIREIKFEIESDLSDRLLIIAVFNFLSIIQQTELRQPRGEWSSVKCGSYVITLFEEGFSKSIIF